MKLLEVFRNNSSKFFSRNTICRTVKAGYVYVEDKDGNKETTKFYNYHATKVTLPQTTESAETK